MLTGSEGRETLSGFSEKKIVNATLFAVLDQFIAGGAGESLEIGHGARIGGEYLQCSTRGHILQGLFGFEDRKWTVKSFCV